MHRPTRCDRKKQIDGWQFGAATVSMPSATDLRNYTSREPVQVPLNRVLRPGVAQRSHPTYMRRDASYSGPGHTTAIDPL